VSAPARYSGKEKELRCELCNFRPLIATYGVTRDGVLYIHTYVRKGARMYGNIYSEGTTVIQCRDCLRWHTVVINAGVATLEEAK
jgi:hypothetical protein